MVTATPSGSETHARFQDTHWSVVLAAGRADGCVLLPLDTGDGETRYLLEPADCLTPKAIFEKRWAIAMLERTLAELRRESSTGAKRRQWEEEIRHLISVLGACAVPGKVCAPIRL